MEIITKPIPPVTCPLTDALTTTLEALRQDAARAGLPDVHLGTQCALRDGRLRPSYTILATLPGMEWHNCPVQGHGATLAEAEEAFYKALNQWDNANYEADASRSIDAEIEVYEALQAAA